MNSKQTAIPQIDTARCSGCGRCVAACRPHLLSLEPQGWVKFATFHDRARCTGCGVCAVACPFHAVMMLGDPEVEACCEQAAV